MRKVLIEGRSSGSPTSQHKFTRAELELSAASVKREADRQQEWVAYRLVFCCIDGMPPKSSHYDRGCPEHEYCAPSALTRALILCRAVTRVSQKKAQVTIGAKP